MKVYEIKRTFSFHIIFIFFGKQTLYDVISSFRFSKLKISFLNYFIQIAYNISFHYLAAGIHLLFITYSYHYFLSYFCFCINDMSILLSPFSFII